MLKYEDEQLHCKPKIIQDKIPESAIHMLFHMLQRLVS